MTSFFTSVSASSFIDLSLHSCREQDFQVLEALAKRTWTSTQRDGDENDEMVADHERLSQLRALCKRSKHYSFTKEVLSTVFPRVDRTRTSAGQRSSFCAILGEIKWIRSSANQSKPRWPNPALSIRRSLHAHWQSSSPPPTGSTAPWCQWTETAAEHIRAAKPFVTASTQFPTPFGLFWSCVNMYPTVFYWKIRRWRASHKYDHKNTGQAQKTNKSRSRLSSLDEDINRAQRTID